MENKMTNAEQVIANASEKIREAHSQRIEEIRNKDFYASRLARANVQKKISEFIVEVLSDQSTKENPAMIVAIAELSKII